MSATPTTAQINTPTRAPLPTLPGAPGSALGPRPGLSFAPTTLSSSFTTPLRTGTSTGSGLAGAAQPGAPFTNGIASHAGAPASAATSTPLKPFSAVGLGGASASFTAATTTAASAPAAGPATATPGEKTAFRMRVCASCVSFRCVRVFQSERRVFSCVFN